MHRLQVRLDKELMSLNFEALLGAFLRRLVKEC